MTRHHGTACRLPGRRPRGHFPTGLSGPWLAALVLCVLLGACGSSPRATAPSPGALVTSPAATSQQAAGSAAQAVSNVFRSPLLKPQLFVTDGAVFVAWQTSLPGSAAVLSELARIDAATGRIQARQLFSAYVPQVLEAGGSLWVAAWTGSVSASETLLKLNPDTLGVTRRWHIGTGGESAWAAQVLAVAHGGLWTAAGNRLVRVSLPSGKMTATVALPGADSSDVSANAAGTKLVVGEANSEGLGAVQRRDTTTGALLASHRVLGVAAPAVAGRLRRVDIRGDRDAGLRPAARCCLDERSWKHLCGRANHSHVRSGRQRRHSPRRRRTAVGHPGSRRERPQLLRGPRRWPETRGDRAPSAKR